MKSYFEKGEMKMSEAIGNVQTSLLHDQRQGQFAGGVNYLETDTMRMYLGVAKKAG